MYGGTGVVFLFVGAMGDTSLQRWCVLTYALLAFFAFFVNTIWFFFPVEISDTPWSGGKDRCILFDVFVLFH